MAKKRLTLRQRLFFGTKRQRALAEEKAERALQPERKRDKKLSAQLKGCSYVPIRRKKSVARTSVKRKAVKAVKKSVVATKGGGGSTSWDKKYQIKTIEAVSNLPAPADIYPTGITQETVIASYEKINAAVNQSTQLALDWLKGGTEIQKKQATAFLQAY